MAINTKIVTPPQRAKGLSSKQVIVAKAAKDCTCRMCLECMMRRKGMLK
jgi:hypothetical protein